MQIRTFLGILAALLLVAVLAGLSYQNQDLLDQRFQLTPTRDIPLWTLIIGAYLTGVFSFIVAFLLRGSADLVDRWRMLQGRRAGRAVDELYNRGIEAVLEGREERALDHFQAILKRDPDHFQALLKSGAVLRTLKRANESVDLHKRAHRLHDMALEPLYELVKDYEALDQVAKAKVVLNRLIELRPKRALSAYRKLRRYAIKEGDWDRAWEVQGLIERQVERSPQKLETERRFNVGIRYEMAAAAARGGRVRDAIGSLRKILKSDPHFVPAYLKLGEILVKQGAPDDAADVWAEGFEKTTSPAFLTRIEEHFLGDEDPEGAIQALQGAVAHSRRDFLPRLFLAKLYLRLEMIDEAHREFSTLAGRAASSPTLHAHLGYVQERRQDHRAAAASYRQVIQDLDYLSLQYRCQACGKGYVKWVDRCAACGEWNQIGLDFGEDPTLEDLDISTGPVYSRTA